MPKEKINLKKLPASLLPVLADYAAARDARRALEAEARATAKTLVRAQDRILAALDGAEVAACGGLLVTVKHGDPIEASLTLNDQSTVPWKEVSHVFIGQRKVAGTDVVSLYGGRSGGVAITTAKRRGA